MSKTRRKGRMTFDGAWSGSPLFTGGGFDHLGKTLSLENHAHEGYELTYISEGETVWVLENGEELRLVGGSAALIQPGTIHHGKNQVIAPSRLFWLVFNPSVENAARGSVFSREELLEVNDILRRAGNAVWRADDSLRRSFELFYDAMVAKSDSERSSFAHACCLTASSQLVLATVHSLERRDCDRIGTSLFSKARQLMSESLLEPPSIPRLAERLGVSPAFFSERFKRESGLTPGDYMRRMRCEKACEMLSRTDSSVTRIAFDLGFSTSQHFSDLFKRYIGMSPRQFRQTRDKRQDKYGPRLTRMPA